jgi:hypothetical protein
VERRTLIVKFSTRYDQVFMHGEAALALLRGMGHTGNVPGAILAVDLPDALARLERTLEASGDSVPVPPAPTPPGQGTGTPEHDPPITLRTRAVPVLEMLRTAIARGGSDLVWERA